MHPLRVGLLEFKPLNIKQLSVLGGSLVNALERDARIPLVNSQLGFIIAPDEGNGDWSAKIADPCSLIELLDIEEHMESDEEYPRIELPETIICWKPFKRDGRLEGILAWKVPQYDLAFLVRGVPRKSGLRLIFRVKQVLVVATVAPYLEGSDVEYEVRAQRIKKILKSTFNIMVKSEIVKPPRENTGNTQASSSSRKSAKKILKTISSVRISVSGGHTGLTVASTVIKWLRDRKATREGFVFIVVGPKSHQVRRSAGKPLVARLLEDMLKDPEVKVLLLYQEKPIAINDHHFYLGRTAVQLAFNDAFQHGSTKDTGSIEFMSSMRSLEEGSIIVATHEAALRAAGPNASDNEAFANLKSVVDEILWREEPAPIIVLQERVSEEDSRVIYRASKGWLLAYTNVVPGFHSRVYAVPTTPKSLYEIFVNVMGLPKEEACRLIDDVVQRINLRIHVNSARLGGKSERALNHLMETLLRETEPIEAAPPRLRRAVNEASFALEQFIQRLNNGKAVSNTSNLEGQTMITMIPSEMLSTRHGSQRAWHLLYIINILKGIAFTIEKCHARYIRDVRLPEVREDVFRGGIRVRGPWSSRWQHPSSSDSG
ncbi:MAG: hypothetical protein F7B17_01120 [Desulfurococcales archaeon]|nr:hypothetical protein [Desulfurococcales archaeon]